MPSLEDLLRHALPGEAEVLVGAHRLARPISWVVRLRARAPALPPLSGSEVIIASTAAIDSLDARPSLAQVVDQVAQLGAAALLVMGHADAAAERAAERHDLPLVLLHATLRPEALELELQHWLVQRQVEVQRELSTLHHELTSLALAGGFPALLERTARVTGKSTLLLAPDGAVRLRRQPSGTGALPAEAIDAALAVSRPKVERLAGERSDGRSESRVVRLAVPDLGLMQLVAGVQDSVGTGAYLALVGRVEEVGERDADALLAAAGAGSIELVREHASEAARIAVEGDVLDRLSEGNIEHADSLRRRASRLGHDLDVAHIALALRSSAADEAHIAETLQRLATTLPVLVGRRNGHILALVPAQGDGDVVGPPSAGATFVSGDLASAAAAADAGWIGAGPAAAGAGASAGWRSRSAGGGPGAAAARSSSAATSDGGGPGAAAARPSSAATSDGSVGARSASASGSTIAGAGAGSGGSGAASAVAGAGAAAWRPAAADAGGGVVAGGGSAAAGLGANGSVGVGSAAGAAGWRSAAGEGAGSDWGVEIADVEEVNGSGPFDAPRSGTGSGAGSGAGFDALRRVREWHARARRVLGPFAVGASGPVAGVHELARALSEARQALDLGERLLGPDRLVSFADLGVFTFLLRSQAPDTLREFHASTLGRLVAYDAARGAELLPTLEAYFASRCSPDATAKRLHLHRNSLLYRLRRIEEIAGVRLSDPETRLQLHLGLRVGQVLAVPLA